MRQTIDDFRGAYRYLSNFHVADVMYEGVLYPSSEHAYQAAKDLRFETRSRFIDRAVTCGQAKRTGGRNGIVTLRADWEDVKEQVMYDIVNDKFMRHFALRTALLNTGDAVLIEGNYWHDNTWGSCRCTRCGDAGLNSLGKILMRIREEARGGVK